MSCNQILYHPSLAGLLNDEMIRVVHRQEDGREGLGEVDIRWGRGTARPYRVKGLFHMIFIETYDILVFSLLRGMFGLEYPNVLVADYRPEYIGDPENIKLRPYLNPVALVKKMDDRELQESDIWPPSEKNYLMRFRLGVLVLFCRVVGAAFFLGNVRVQNGIPYIWRVHKVGEKKALTLSKKQFADLFGFKVEQLNKDENYRIPGIDDPSINAVMTRIVDRIRKKQEFQASMPPLFDLAVRYLKECDFDLDVLRELVHLRENPVRGRLSSKGRLKLALPVAQILANIEENYSILDGPSPLDLFSFPVD